MMATKMKWGKTDFISFIIILIPIIITIFLYNKLPDQLATHFGTNGEANGFQGKITFLLTNALLLIGVPLLMKASRYMDPKKKNYDKFEPTYDMFRVILTAFLSVMYITVLFYNLGYNVNIQMIILIGIGILFIFLGNYMSRIRFNYTIGIRTPWTLANEEVWRKTHRLAGPIWFIGGVAVIFLAFIPGSLAFVLLMVVLAIISIIPIVYSFLLFKNFDKE